jgi:hypothetical protein
MATEISNTDMEVDTAYNLTIAYQTGFSADDKVSTSTACSY